MKNKTAYIYLLCLGLLLKASTILAQTGSEIKFNLSNESSTPDKNLVAVSTIVDAKQPVSGNGIHFTLIVRNNSGNAISLKNIVSQLSVSLFNEEGLNIAVSNEALNDIKINKGPTENRKWRFHSESVVSDLPSVNGRKESGDFKKQEYIQIPAGGNWKVNLTIKNVKQVTTPQDVQNRMLKLTKSLSPGKYKLKLFLPVVAVQQNKSVKNSAIYLSPMIDIDYTK